MHPHFFSAIHKKSVTTYITAFSSGERSRWDYWSLMCSCGGYMKPEIKLFGSMQACNSCLLYSIHTRSHALSMLLNGDEITNTDYR